MGILSDGAIMRRLRAGSLVIEPFDEQFLQPNSYDVHLHPDVLLMHSEEPFRPLDPSEDCSWAFIPGNIDTDGAGTILLMPDTCILGRTVQRFVFPNDLAGRIEGVSTNGRIFLKIHVTAGFFDAGFQGTATLEIKNLSPRPIILRSKMRIGQMSFEELTNPAFRPYGPRNRYLGQMDPTPARSLNSTPTGDSERWEESVGDIHDRHDRHRVRSPRPKKDVLQPLHAEGEQGDGEHKSQESGEED